MHHPSAPAADRLVLKPVEAGLRNSAQTWEQARARRTRELLNGIVEWLLLLPDGDDARLSLKLHPLPEMVAKVPRSQTKDREATGVDGLSLRDLAMRAHLADGRSGRGRPARTRAALYAGGQKA